MSMLSAQCDELRSMAESIGLEVPQAATLMMGAADTIDELRDDLQRANAENSRMRDELESVGTAAYLYGRSDLKAENAKLRELALVLRHCADGCGDCDTCLINGAHPVPHVWFGCDTLREMMRRLGLEEG